MPTPEQQEEYTRLSAQLQLIGQRYFKELPHGSVSLVLTVNQGNVLVEAYDRMGRKLGDIPNQWTSKWVSLGVTDGICGTDFAG
jgi:hypothetical protein